MLFVSVELNFCDLIYFFKMDSDHGRQYVIDIYTVVNITFRIQPIYFLFKRIFETYI